MEYFCRRLKTKCRLLSFILLLACLLPMPLSAEALDSNSTGAAYLFEIQENDGPVSYLFGTIHLPDARVTRLREPVRKAFGESDAVFTEIAMSDSAMIAMAPKVLLEGGQTLPDLLPASTLVRLDQRLKKINPELDARPFYVMKIWVVASTLMLLETQMENPGVQPMDLAIYKIADNRGKVVGGIETIDEQVAVFDAFSVAEQTKLLDSLLDVMDEMEATNVSYTDLLVDGYLTGDLDTIEALMVSYADEDAELQAKFERLFIEERNFKMAERIAKNLRENPGRQSFFAVGVAHLYGEDGLVKLLRDDGFSVTQVLEE